MLDDLFVEKSASFQLIEIDNTKEASVNGKWKDPGAALYIQLLNAMYMAPDNESDLNDPRNKYTPDYLKETYLIAPINKIKYGPYGMTPFSRSGCKYPHHVIRKGKLVVHIQGLKAAYARAKQMGIFSGEVKEHLERHYKELGLYEGSKMQLDESIEQNFSDIENYIAEETGIDLYSTKDLFEERSHGNLKESYHVGWDPKTGHFINIICTLDQKNIKLLGSDGILDRPDRNTSDKKVRSFNNTKTYKVSKHGHTDYLSRERIIQIIDLDTKKPIKSCSIIGIISLRQFIFDMIDAPAQIERLKNIGKYEEFKKLWNRCIGEGSKGHAFLQINYLDSPLQFRRFLASVFDDVRVRDYTIRMFKVGDMEPIDGTFKSTHYPNPVSSVMAGMSGTGQFKIKYPTSVFDSPTAIQPLYRSRGKKLESEMSKSRKFLNTESCNNIESILESFQWMDHFFEAEDNNEPPQVPTEETHGEEISKKEEDPKNDDKLSFPKKIDKQESDKNGVRRKKLYIAFIEWAKEYNPKNIFGSIFDKDVFQTVYPFVPNEMRYFYRLANPILCVLAGNLTFFSAGELKKLNAKNSRLSEFMIFAATDEDLRVFNNKDKKIYRALEENGMIKLDIVLGETFDTYIQNMINQGDILNGPIDDEVIKK